MIKMFRFIKPYLVSAILSPLCMFIEVACEICLPLIMSDVMNIGVKNNNLHYIALRGLLMVVLALIGAAGGIGCQYFSAKVSQRSARDVRLALFEKVQLFSFVDADKFHTSSLITRLTNDVTQFQQIVLSFLRMLVRSPLLFLGGLAATYIISPELTKTLLLSIILVIVCIFIIIHYGLPLFKKVQESIDGLNTTMRENLSGVRVIRAFVREKKEIQKFDEKNSALKKANIAALKVMVFSTPVMMFIFNIATIYILYKGSSMFYIGDIETGDLMAYVSYITQILMSLLMTSNVLLNVSRAKVSVDRINEVLNTDISIKDCEKPLTDCISADTVEFRNVKFKYPGGTGEPVLENISFTASKGETIGILGETGVGKSTLVNLIPRLYDVTDGEILIDNINIKDIKTEYLRSKIGFVLQKALLFSGTIKDNIKWGNENASDEEVKDAAKKAQAYDFIMDFKDSFDTMLGQGGVNLSGGQKQRISIARTLIKKPCILIFDDSTSALDLKTEAKIQKTLRSEFNDTIKFIIAQKISSVMYADKIIVLSSGTVNAIGTHSQLLESCDIYRDIYKSQIKED